MLLQDMEALIGAYLAVVIIVGLIALAINIALMVYVYKDAEKRDMGGALWLIIVFLTNLLGCLIYLIVRGNHPEK